MNFKLTKQFRFEAAHRLANHDGKCRNLHGHSYVLEVTVEGDVSSDSGMIVDFAVLKSAVSPIVESLDHSYIAGSEEVPQPGSDKVYFLDKDQSTAENIVDCLWLRISGRLPTTVTLSKLRLYETTTGWTEMSR